MTKEEYIKALQNYIDYNEYEDKLANLNINIWEQEEVSNFVTNYLNMLAELVGDEPDEGGYTWTDYFCYESDCGKNDLGPVEINGVQYSLKTPADVWDLIHLDK